MTPEERAFEAADSLGVVTAAGPPTQALVEVCGLPEIAPQLREQPLRVFEDQVVPVEVCDGIIRIAGAVCGEFTTAALAVREGLELVTLGVERDDDRTADWLARRILARFTAVAYLEIRHGRHVIDPQTVSGPVRGAVRAVVADLPAPALDIRQRAVEAVVDELDLPAGRDLTHAVTMATGSLVTAVPTAALMASGGDDRQLVDWESGENRYGVSPVPRPWFASFSSCTASSPSEHAFGVADALRIELVEAALHDRLFDFVEEHWVGIRSHVARSLGVSPNADVAVLPTPSGTDAEYIGLLAAVATGRPVTVIIVGPSEVGSGTDRAATGRHFSTQTPNGRPAQPGELLVGVPDDVRVESVDVRRGDGSLRPVEELEDEIGRHVRRHIGDDQQVLVHLVDGTKTGIRAPRDATLKSWSDEFGDRLDMVVDAAQTRIDQERMGEHLDAGRSVIMTGSKFFAGPPFSGAVLVPAAITERLRACAPFPGLVDYLDRRAIPPQLTRLRGALPDEPNLGLLLRWWAASREMAAFLSVSPPIRDEILRALATGVLDAVEAAPGIELVPSPYTTAPDADQGLTDLPTIFTIRLLSSDHEFTFDDLRLVQLLARIDLSAHSPTVDAASRAVLGRQIELGQPVRLGPPTSDLAALRLAYGAPTLSRVVFDHTRGPDWRTRLDRELLDTRDALLKLSLIAHLWPDLSSIGAADSPLHDRRQYSHTKS